MTRPRRLALLVALATTVGVNAAFAVPAQAAAEMRAVSHCTSHTGRPATLPEARHCCRVSDQATAPAAQSTVERSPLPPAGVLALALPPAPLPLAGVLVPLDARGSRDGPPLFVALRTFRC